MKISRFISVGENIHCTRVYKVNGAFVKPDNNGNYNISYTSANNETGLLPVPEHFTETADWQSGKVKHCAVAIWQGTKGNDADSKAGIDYIQSLARRQESSGATYLDLNVDEFSTDVAERVELMKWLVSTVQPIVSIPMSIDSSNSDILRAGLSACDKTRAKPMLNSVSLERLSAVELSSEFKTVVIASAAGEKDLPTTTEARMANIARLMPTLQQAGLSLSDIHIDPLVFPISTDGNNGNGFIDAVKAIRNEYGSEIHIAAGLSNISFGMPNRKLITQVFTYLVVEAGGDGGIVDPIQVNIDILNNTDVNSEQFKLAKALLTGEDEYGMEFITASREGTI